MLLLIAYYRKGKSMITLLSKLFIKNYVCTTDPKVRQGYGTLCSVTGILLNLMLFGVKLFAGTLAGSVAIFADAFNNLSDAGSSLVTLLGFKIAAKKPDASHPFGHGRSEYIAGLIVSFLIIIMGFELFKGSVGKILSPESITFSYLSAAILGISVAVKLYMAYYNHSIGKKIASAAMRATGADCISDALSTLVVLVSMFVFKFSGLNIDAWCGVLVSFFIFAAGIRSAAETISPLLGQQADPETVIAIEKTVMSFPQALGIHDLIVHDYGGGRTIASLHVEVDANGDFLTLHDTVDNMERLISENLNCIVTVHMDPIVTDDPELSEIKAVVNEYLSKKYPSVMTHDFRMVRGDTHTNVIFDAVVPFDIKETELAENLKRTVNEYNSCYFAVINIDRKYS